MSTDNCKQLYAFLDQLSTEQLMEFLRADADSPEGGDEDVVLHILEVIERRECEEPSGLFPVVDVDRAWEEFQTYFNTPDREGRCLYPIGEDRPEEEEEPAGKICQTGARAPFEGKPEKGGKSHPRLRRLCRRAILVAATVVVLFTGMIAAQAMGFDLFGSIAKWTSETFFFAGTQEEGETQEQVSARYYQSMQNALRTCGLPGTLAPGWYPAGSTMPNDIEARSNNDGKMVSANFEIGEDLYFSIGIAELNDDSLSMMTLQKDDSDVTEYLSRNRLFYIYSNVENIVASWSDEQFLISVEGNIPVEDVKQIIDSIGG